MKKALNVIICLFIVLCVLAQVTWVEAQKIKTIDGVKVIINGKKPKPVKGEPSKLKLNEEIAIGEGDNPDEAFSEVSAFVVDDDGNIYALDFKDRKIKVYDREGKFLRMIGRKGQGPGELDMPSGIHITSDNELLIEDATTRRLAYFTLEGEFIKNVSLANKMGLVNLVFDKKGNCLGREIGLAENKMFFEIKKYDKDIKPLFSIDKIEFAVPVPGTKLNIMDIISIFQFDSKGNIFYGRNREYEIKVYHPEGKHVYSIRKEYNPVKITQEDIDEILERIPDTGTRGMFEFPKYFPPFQNFIMDEQDRMYVRTWEKGKNKDEYVIDIFDPEGKFISQITTKADLRLWKNNELYTIEETDTGFRVIKRYSVSWEK
ncbi:MAG: 6-bladed beta-propeller [Acidobacteriota bacterium]|nr:6-bladed beta-propeller [Acidobacteriota bacterium]